MEAFLRVVRRSKYILFLLAFLSVFYSFLKKGENVRVAIESEDVRLSVECLDSLTSSVVALDQKKHQMVYFAAGDSDQAARFVVGRFIDDKNIYAIDISVQDSLISFYCLDRNVRWQQVGGLKSEDDLSWIYFIEFEDLDGDGRNEVILSTHPNMNGNRWMDIYYCSPQNSTFHYSGSISTEYEVKKKNKTIEVDYGGSFYMDQIKTLYQWRGEMLIPIKRAVLVLDQEKVVDDIYNYSYEYYENPASDKDSLVLLFEHSYEEKDEKLWRNFFR